MTTYTLDSKQTLLNNPGYVECPRCAGAGNFEVYRHVWNGDCYLCLGNGAVTAAKADKWAKKNVIKETNYADYSLKLYVDDRNRPSKIVLTEHKPTGDRLAEIWVWKTVTILDRTGATQSEYQSWVDCGGMGREVEEEWLRNFWKIYKAGGTKTLKQQVKGKLKKWVPA